MNEKLEWSEPMGPNTWDEVVEIIKQKGGGWRLPTIEELDRSDESNSPPEEYMSYWSCFESKSNFDVWCSRNRHLDLVEVKPKDYKAEFLLVREV